MCSTSRPAEAVQYEVIAPGVAFRTHPEYSAHADQVRGPELFSKVTASVRCWLSSAADSSQVTAARPPITALGSTVQMIQASHVNGQLHVPPGGHSHYWLPLTTLDGAEVLRKVNADTAGDPSDSFEWVDAVENSSMAGAGASSYALTVSFYAMTVSGYADMANDAPPPYREAPEYAQAVAAEWVEANAPDGRRYWYKRGTIETTWQDPHGGTAPVLEQSTPPPPPLPPPAAQIWDQLTADSNGQAYFHNPSTNETAWQLPPGAILRATPARQPARPHTAQLPARQTETSWPAAAERVVRDTVSETFDEITSFFRSKPPAGRTQSSAQPPSRELRESRLAEARNRGAGASSIGMPPGMTGMPGFRGAGG